ncbi:MAG: hypothetical protein EXR98_15325 [Gemmataceae bacterium]|nr:hypothetical protein [Gemmataceae bacterium]
MSSPRLLLFGTPGAGKSALLGALVQAAPALKAEVADKRGELEELKNSTYADTIAPTNAIDSYDLHVKPENRASAWAAHRLTVLDCSGKTAAQMLQAEEPFAKKHPLHKPIFDADAVVLAVDASVTNKELKDEFAQFGHWLRALYETRARRTDIADLPVYLVLTKCDLLASKADTHAEWMLRIEDGKRKVEEKFREYLKEQGPGFGTVRLQLWATSIKRPALADRKPRAQEPFGVAELFRQCLQSANEFQERRQRSANRLQNVVAGLIGLIVVLGLIVTLLLEFDPPTRGTTLEEKAQTVLPRKDATIVERLQGGLKKLEEKQAKLAEVKKSPDFDRLPDETQKMVTDYHDEIARYIELHHQAQATLKLPHFDNETNFNELEKNVNQFVVPADWSETSVGRRAQKCREEFAAVRKAAATEEDWLSRQIKANNALLDQSDALYKKVRDKLKASDEEFAAWKKLKGEYDGQIQKRPAMPRQDLIAGVTRVKHDDLGMFATIKDARADWQRSKQMLLDRSEYIQERIKK